MRILYGGISMLIPGLCSARPALNFELLVRDGSGVGFADFPVTAGFPLPEGWVQDLNSLRILAPGGAPAAAQFQALNRWWLKGGGVRNAMVIFLGNAAANGSARYTVVSDGGRNPAPSRAVRVERQGARFRIATGTFTATVGGANLIDSMSFDADGDGRFESGELIIGPGGPGPVLIGARGGANDDKRERYIIRGGGHGDDDFLSNGKAEP